MSGNGASHDQRDRAQAASTVHVRGRRRGAEQSALPVLVYQGGARSRRHAAIPAAAIEKLFTANGWGRDMWRNGIYPYVHYHSMIHEVLGIARGRARVRFGGDKGERFDIEAGDVAGAAGRHRPSAAMSAATISCVVGAYPPDGKYNLCRGSKAEHDKALDHHPPGAAAGQRSGAGQGRPAAQGVAALARGRRGITRLHGLDQLLRFRALVIYVNARHRDVHYRTIAEDIRGYVPPHSAQRAGLRLRRSDLGRSGRRRRRRI